MAATQRTFDRLAAAERALFERMTDAQLEALASTLPQAERERIEALSDAELAALAGRPI